MALLRTLCWALIFILRLRIPPGSSLASILALYTASQWAGVYYYGAVRIRHAKNALGLCTH